MITAAPPAVASVIITTKNRKEELREALASCVAQTVPVEVLVIDDGSTDGTAAVVEAEFPGVRLIRHEQSLGSIVGRNEGARAARTPFMFSLDDDSSFGHERMVEETLRDFTPPRVGAVAIPYCNVNQSPVVLQNPPDVGECYVVPHYVNAAFACRLDLFLALGGYRDNFVHMGEEGDYAYRLFAAGYVTRLGTSRRITHLESPRRSFRQIDFNQARNLIQFAWHNVPMPQLLAHLPGTTFNCLRAAARHRRLWNPFRGLASGYWALLTGKVRREPATRDAYRLYRRLVREGPLKLSELEPQLPPPRFGFGPPPSQPNV